MTVGSKSDHVLGINVVYHETSAAILRNQELLGAVEEERFTRIRHAKRSRVTNADELPMHAIQWCLDCAGQIPLRDMDAIGISYKPGRRWSMIGVDTHEIDKEDGFGTDWGERCMDRLVCGIPTKLAAAAKDPSLRNRVHFIPHHQSHAAAALYASPFDRAAILVVDGIGESSTVWLGRGGADGLECIEEIVYPHSLGFLWERISCYLGFDAHDAAKVMGLAAYGNAVHAAAGLDQLLQLDGAGTTGSSPPFGIDAGLAGFRQRHLCGLESVFGPARCADEDPTMARFADVAAALQEKTDAALMKLAQRLHRLTGEANLVYTGGVALNCVTNSRLEREGPFERMYILGASHDAGTAIGAAISAGNSGRNSNARWTRTARDQPLTSLLGPSFDDDEVDDVLRRWQIPIRIVEHAEAYAAELLTKGAIVGWFDGHLEFGPRALGSRSLLADPRNASQREILNQRIKHREPYRPFAASVLEEEARTWFQLPNGRPGAVASRDLMILCYPVHEARQAQIPAVLHADNSCRIQTVSQSRQPRFHRLIREFGKRTGVPLVLNTSFNDGEPLVATPDHALETFTRTHLDALFLNNRLVVKGGTNAT